MGWCRLRQWVARIARGEVRRIKENEALAITMANTAASILEISDGAVEGSGNRHVLAIKENEEANGEETGNSQEGQAASDPGHIPITADKLKQSPSPKESEDRPAPPRLRPRFGQAGLAKMMAHLGEGPQEMPQLPSLQGTADCFVPRRLVHTRPRAIQAEVMNDGLGNPVSLAANMSQSAGGNGLRTETKQEPDNVQYNNRITGTGPSRLDAKQNPAPASERAVKREPKVHSPEHVGRTSKHRAISEQVNENQDTSTSNKTGHPVLDATRATPKPSNPQLKRKAEGISDTLQEAESSTRQRLDTSGNSRPINLPVAPPNTDKIEIVQPKAPTQRPGHEQPSPSAAPATDKVQPTDRGATSAKPVQFNHQLKRKAEGISDTLQTAESSTRQRLDASGNSRPISLPAAPANTGHGNPEAPTPQSEIIQPADPTNTAQDNPTGETEIAGPTNTGHSNPTEIVRPAAPTHSGHGSQEVPTTQTEIDQLHPDNSEWVPGRSLVMITFHTSAHVSPPYSGGAASGWLGPQHGLLQGHGPIALAYFIDLLRRNHGIGVRLVVRVLQVTVGAKTFSVDVMDARAEFGWTMILGLMLLGGSAPVAHVKAIVWEEVQCERVGD